MIQDEKPYLVLAYYLFTRIADPLAEIESHKNFFNGRDATGRIYISEEGINGQMSASLSDAEAYQAWLSKKECFSGVSFKVHTHHEQCFPRMTVKYRKQLVALDQTVDLSKKGETLSPKQWKEQLEKNEAFLIDVRNDYEWKIGHFEGANLPPLENFRDFSAYADELKETIDPKKTPVMMYCTGGIRCELYSALLKEKGFEEVYQLEGGIIGYGLEEGSAHWKGKLFVFDDRMAVPIDGKPCEPISTCCHCHLPSDTYYNCANMDCNELFLACPSCISTYEGCCSHPCTQAPRLRPYTRDKGNKPFRKKHLLS